MLRFIITALFVTLFLICSIPLFFIEWIIGKFNMDIKNRSSLAIVNWAFRVVLFISGVKITVIGEENVPKDQPVLYIANHQSYFDIVVSYSRCPGLTGYIAKDGLEKVPILSIWMKRLYCLFLNRQDIKEGMKTILKGIDQIKHGISMCIFPEGTRNDNPKELLPFKEGSFKLALKTGCPIIPIAMTNTPKIYEAQAPLLKKTHVVLHYGKPILPNELDADTKKHIGVYTKCVIEQMLEENEQYLETP